MAKKKKDEKKPGEKKEGNKLLTALIAILIAIIWIAIFGLLIKFDVGGFGSGVLRPILKDVPLINKILPDVSDSQLAKENDFTYKSLPEAVAKIKELEQEIDKLNKEKTESGTKTAELQAEIDRLKVFEENQKEYETNKKDFDKNVVFADNAPSLEEYKKYYEQIDPENAAEIYKQVIEQLQYSQSIVDKATIYKNMDPSAAAKILETMTADVDSVAKILLSMKPKDSGAILAQMDNVIAAKITKKMLDLGEEQLNSSN
jgi:flagellar motility protein MotE (MotC chaperone)